MDYNDVYRLSMEFSQTIWDLVQKWPRFAQDTIGKQVVRSSDSVSANLKEGLGRFFYKDRKQFYYYSRGSLAETSCWLEKSQRRNLISKEEYDRLYDQQNKLLFNINRIIKDTLSRS
ncbi:MAG: four helix bundle protein [Bacteroidota bacterium]|jgi:four helix bundle protein